MSFNSSPIVLKFAGAVLNFKFNSDSNSVLSIPLISIKKIIPERVDENKQAKFYDSSTYIAQIYNQGTNYSNYSKLSEFSDNVKVKKQKIQIEKRD